MPRVAVVVALRGRVLGGGEGRRKACVEAITNHPLRIASYVHSPTVPHTPLHINHSEGLLCSQDTAYASSSKDYGQTWYVVHTRDEDEGGGWLEEGEGGSTSRPHQMHEAGLVRKGGRGGRRDVVAVCVS